MPSHKLTPFDRQTFESTGTISYIGSGSIGGKAQGLALVKDLILPRVDPSIIPSISVNMPTMTVLATEIFDSFMAENRLYEIVHDEELRDEQIAHFFLEASLPAKVVGDLRALSNKVRNPLAIRSSSLFEDALREPFAGVYATKMIPHHNEDPDYRFRALTEAIKYVYASTFFRDARNYIKTTNQSPDQEKMAVIIQKVVGFGQNFRFYPVISGVVRSYNFYRSGNAKPEDGIVSLALGLGKTVVEGGKSWTYSPAFPLATPPYKSMRAMLSDTQNNFWAVNLGHVPYDPLEETEYLVQCPLESAELDGTLQLVASTYIADNDRIVSGTASAGPRLVNFAPILKSKELGLNDAIRYLLKLAEVAEGHEVEMEFAVTINSESEPQAKFWILQIRPMFVSHSRVDVATEELLESDNIAASERVLGNGSFNTIRDVVFQKPVIFTDKDSWKVAAELEELNHKLVAMGHPYLLITFGRLGTTDPPAGIPVSWWQVSGAKVIIETSLPDMNVELSQGSHFFHNVISSQVGYFSIPHTGQFRVDWGWLNKQTTVKESEFVRYVKLSAPLRIKIDGRNGRGLIKA